MSEIWRNVWAGFASASPLDRVNLVLGIVGVVLMIRRSLWAFPVGLAAVTVQGVLFFQTKFYADATQQVFFFAALAWGWWHWVRDRGPAAELPVTALGWRARRDCACRDRRDGGVGAGAAALDGRGDALA